MQQEPITRLVKAFAQALGVELSPGTVREELGMVWNLNALPPEVLTSLLNDLGEPAEISFIYSQVGEAQLEEIIRAAALPLLTYIGPKARPALVTQSFLGRITYITFGEDENTHSVTTDDFLTSVHEARQTLNQADHIDDTLPIINALVIKSLFSEAPNEDRKPLTPWRRFLRLVAIERREIAYIYIYAIAVGIFSLTLPVAMNSIVQLISGGLILEPVILLIALVPLGVMISGILQVLQISIVETLQQRVFTRAAFEFAFRVPKIRLEAIRGSYAPELMNRFFDIINIQKGFAKIFTDFLTALLQIVFGLLLVAFYHPFFIFFSILLVVTLVGVIYSLGPRGLKTSLMESKYKYKVTQWLEEVARALPTFKMAGSSNLALEKMDHLVLGYLKKRREHFRVLVWQYSAIVAFKTIIVGGLLILGAYLVVDRQITLGQFVASELVVLLVLNSVEKLILSFDVIYDVLTAVEKVGAVTDLPMDSNRGVLLDTTTSRGVELKLRRFSYQYSDSQHPVLNNLSLDIASGERIGIVGSSNSGKSTLVLALAGLLNDYQGVLAIDGISLRDLNLNSYRARLGLSSAAEDVFDGTLVENLTLGRKTITTDQLIRAIEDAQLADYVQGLPGGLQTHIITGGQQLPSHVVKKIILARSLLSDPRLLLFDEFFHLVEELDKSRLLRNIFEPNEHRPNCTIVVVSKDPQVLAYCDRVVVLHEGAVFKVGSLTDLLKDPFCRDLLAFNQPTAA
jgi:ABC-type bacteriocin/lantibiotic exporter with double-glycine peptidase domain